MFTFVDMSIYVERAAGIIEHDGTPQQADERVTDPIVLYEVGLEPSKEMKISNIFT